MATRRARGQSPLGTGFEHRVSAESRIGESKDDHRHLMTTHLMTTQLMMTQLMTTVRRQRPDIVAPHASPIRDG
jgi:hypothetical protein